MIQQLVFTSAPQGLRPNTRGFTTVAATPAMSPPLMSRLEGMSGYQLAFNLSDPRSSQNPVCHSHVIVELSGQRLHVLSRVAPSGADYSGRSNTLAHHLVLDDGLVPAIGPAVVLRQPGLLMDSWSGESRYLDNTVRFDERSRSPRVCEAWKRATGDAGWGGALGASFVKAPHIPSYVIYPAGADVMQLIDEALAILPAKRQWAVTFSSYFTSPIQGATCVWRFVLDGTPAAKAVNASGSALVIDLTSACPPPVDNEFTRAARQGQVAEIQDGEGRPAMSIARPSRKAVSASAAPLRAKENDTYEVSAPIDVSIGRSVEDVEVGVPQTIYDSPSRKADRSKFPMPVAAAFLAGVLLGGMVVWFFRSPGNPNEAGTDVVTAKDSSGQGQVPPQPVDKRPLSPDTSEQKTEPPAAIGDEKTKELKENPVQSNPIKQSPPTDNGVVKSKDPSSVQEKIPNGHGGQVIGIGIGKSDGKEPEVGGPTVDPAAVEERIKKFRIGLDKLKDVSLGIESAVVIERVDSRPLGSHTFDDCPIRIKVLESIQKRVKLEMITQGKYRLVEEGRGLGSGTTLAELAFELNDSTGKVRFVWDELNAAAWESHKATFRFGVELSPGEWLVLYDKSVAPREEMVSIDFGTKGKVLQESNLHTPAKYGASDRARPFQRVDGNRYKTIEVFNLDLSRAGATAVWKVMCSESASVTSVSTFGVMCDEFQKLDESRKANLKEYQKSLAEYDRIIPDLKGQAKEKKEKERQRVEDERDAKQSEWEQSEDGKKWVQLKTDIRDLHAKIVEAQQLFEDGIKKVTVLEFQDTYGVPTIKYILNSNVSRVELPKSLKSP